MVGFSLFENRYLKKGNYTKNIGIKGVFEKKF